MKRIFWTSFLILAAVVISVAAATAEELKTQSVERLSSATAKQRTLQTKVYSGTFEEILRVRVADVNDVNSDIAAGKTAAAQAVETAVSDPNLCAAQKEIICREIARRTAEPTYQQKQLNGEFLLAVEEISADPNDWIDPNNPEPLEEVEARIAEFKAACLQFVAETGGV